MLSVKLGGIFFHKPFDIGINPICQEAFSMAKSKKVRKHRQAEITLEPDGFSIHTFELSMKLSKSEWKKCKQRLFADQEETGEHWIYLDMNNEWQRSIFISNTIIKLLRLSENWDIQTVMCLLSGSKNTNPPGIYIEKACAGGSRSIRKNRNKPHYSFTKNMVIASP